MSKMIQSLKVTDSETLTQLIAYASQYCNLFSLKITHVNGQKIQMSSVSCSMKFVTGCSSRQCISSPGSAKNQSEMRQPL